MKLTKMLTAALVAVFLCLSAGCAHISKGVNYVGDVLSENPAMVNFAGRQVVARYVSRGNTDEEKAARAIEFDKVASKLRVYVGANPEATVDVLLAELDSLIPWDKMSPEDRFLVADIVSMFEMELRVYALDNQVQIDKDSRIALDSFLETLISAARLAVAL